MDVLLSLQNPDGGFASYELIRAPQILEYLNPAEVFGESARVQGRVEGLLRVSSPREHHDGVQLPRVHDVRHHRVVHLSEAQPEIPHQRYPVSAPSLSYTSSFDVTCYSLRRTITKAVDFLHKAQRPEGPWFGSWGICFTYATQFALESLSLVGETYENSAYARKACDFLIGKQRADGGWGESYKVRPVCIACLMLRV